MKWQPIETAPKDGTKILLGNVFWKCVRCGCWWEQMKRKPDRWNSYTGPLTFVPTHWMPLPEPPKGEDQ